MQQREEKVLESALDSIVQRINDLKSSIASMIMKVENEYDTMHWPSFLDNYALISGQVIHSANLHFDLSTQHTFSVNIINESSISR